MKLPRPVVLISALTTLVLISVFFSILLLPRLIDSRLIRDKLSSELEKETEGRVTLGKIAFLWFPRPAVQIEDAKVAFDDKTQGSIRTTKIYPSIFYLFSGRVVVRRALLHEPKLRVLLPESPQDPLDLKEVEKQIRSILVRLSRELPVPRIDLSDGSAEIRIGDKPPLIFENVEAQTVASPAELRFEFSARSNLCERFKIEGNIAPENLVSELDMSVQRLKIKESLSLFPLQISEYAQEGEASFDMKIASVGLGQVKAAIGGSLGPFVFARRGGTVTVEAKKLKGELFTKPAPFK